MAKKASKSNVLTYPSKKPAGGKAPAPGTGVARQDDTRVMALDLPPGTLSPAMEAYFKKCQEKLGFVPNVLLAYAFDNAKLEAFAAFYNDLMLAPSGLSKLEREMIAVAVSAQNRCYYCLTAHGAAVRVYSGDPALGELMVMNYRAAKLTKKQRAMLDFAVKMTTESYAIEEEDREGELVTRYALKVLGYLTPDVLVQKIQTLDHRLARSEDEAVAATNEKGQLLTDLKACAKRTWGKRLGEVGLNPRVASRLMSVGAWGRDFGPVGSDLLAKLPQDVQKLEWLVKLAPESLRQFVEDIDCRAKPRATVIKAVKDPGKTK